MQFTGPFRKQIRLAIQDAYPTLDALRVMVEESLSVPLQSVTMARDMPTVTFDLIIWAIAQGRATELVQAATANNPGNPLLKEVAGNYSFVPASEGEIERVVLENVGFQNIAQWLDKLSRIRHCVCRVEPQPPAEGLDGYGSGFLIGPDLVLTNYHVIESFHDPGLVRFRFDYETDAAGIAVNAGVEHSLATSQWELASSPVESLDYALVRLSSGAANDEISGRPRGFMRLKSHDFHAGEPLLILQHPAAEPLKLSIGSVTNAKEPEDWVSYSANTKGGSSGSPCLTMALETVALHHQGAETENRGVLWSSIASDLEQSGKLGLLPK